jgi:hypothetical protein
MAYGSTTWTTTTVASATGWKVTVTHGYAQNPNTNKSYRYCQSLSMVASSGYSMYNQNSNQARMGIKAGSNASGPTYVTYTISSGGTYTFSPGTVTSAEFSHNADGSASSPPSVSWWCDPGQTESTLTYTNFPSYTRAAWHEFTPTMPTLSRTRPTSTSTVSNIGTTFFTINFSGTCSSYNTISKYIYQIGSNTAVTTTATSASITGMVAGTTYSVNTYSVDDWGWQSSAKTISVTTTSSGSSTTATNGKPLIRVNGVWKNSTAAYVKVSGSWKTVTKTYVKVSGTWKLLKS